MIELTQLNGTSFVLNCNLIETVENIPETKISLTNGKYFLVAELNNEIAGFVCGTINKADNISLINNGETYIEVEDIYTAKDNRGKNIGTLLLDRVLEVAKENGARNSN